MVSSKWDIPGVAEKLMALAKEGLSASEITKQLNDEFNASFSRNAVIGRIHRRKLDWNSGLTTARPKAEKGKTQKRRNGSADGGLVQALRARAARACKPLPEIVVAVEPAVEETASAEIPDFLSSFRPVTIQELTADTCRWPLGPVTQLPPYDYCGRKPIEGSPYCEYHAQKAKGSWITKPKGTTGSTR